MRGEGQGARVEARGARGKEWMTRGEGRGAKDRREKTGI